MLHFYAVLPSDGQKRPALHGILCILYLLEGIGTFSTEMIFSSVEKIKLEEKIPNI